MPQTPDEATERLKRWAVRLKRVADNVYGDGSDRALECHEAIDTCLTTHEGSRHRPDYIAALLRTRIQAKFPEMIAHINEAGSATSEA